MTLVEKLEFITQWYAGKHREPVRKLSKTGRSPAIGKLESMTGLLLPDWYKELYAAYNGEIGSGLGSFISESFLSIDEVLTNAAFASSLVKPAERKTDNSPQFSRTVDEILAIVRLSVPEGMEWQRIEFDCSPGSLGGPYLYRNDAGREPFSLEWPAQKKIMEATRELNELERKQYNWDQLRFVAFPDTFHIERVDHDFDSQLSSQPPGAIRLKYFHLKWIPVFGDHGGNFIGIDFDPDVEGSLGQVIIFGRDENEMTVLSGSMNGFLDLVMDTIRTNEKLLLGPDHPHEILARLVGRR